MNKQSDEISFKVFNELKQLGIINLIKEMESFKVKDARCTPKFGLSKCISIAFNISPTMASNMVYLLRHGSNELLSMVPNKIGFHSAVKFAHLEKSKQILIIKSGGIPAIKQYLLTNRNISEDALIRFKNFDKQLNIDIKEKVDAFHSVFGIDTNICIPGTRKQYECTFCNLEFDIFEEINPKVFRCPRCHRGIRTLKVRKFEE